MDDPISAPSSVPQTGNYVSGHRPDAFVVFWLMEEMSDEIYEALIQLLRTVNEVIAFHGQAELFEYLRLMHRERIILVYSPSDNWKGLLPTVHDLPQIDTVYILSSWQEGSQIYPPLKKNKYISTMDLQEAIRRDCAKAERQLLDFNVIGKSDIGDARSVVQDTQEASFMFSLLLKEIILKTNDGDEHEMVDFCRRQGRDDRHFLSIMDELTSRYTSRSAISWYTGDYILHGMLNKALRDQHLGTIYAFRFFIRELHTQLTGMPKMEEEQMLYRGVRMPNYYFEQIRTNLGGLFSSTSFLSTSMNKNVARAFSGEGHDDSTTTPVIMVIRVNKEMLRDAVLANITDESQYVDEDEWLFSFNTVFRVDNIEKEDGIAGLWLVHLSLTNDQDDQLMALKEHFKTTIHDSNPLVELGRLAYEIGNTKDAETFYRKALESEKDWEGRSVILSNLGAICDDHGDCDQALVYYQQSMDIEKEHRPERHPSFGPTYNNMGIILWKRKQYEDALSCFQLAIDHENAASEINQEMVVNSYNNMGTVLFSLERYEESLAVKLSACDIKVKTLPTMHPSIAISYENIAESLYQCNRLQEATDYMEKAVDIDLRSLPSGHTQTIAHQRILTSYRDKLDGDTHNTDSNN